MVPCPHCGHLQALVWEGLVWEKGKPETAKYRCGASTPGAADKDGVALACGELIDESHKPWMLAEALTYGNHGWHATNPGGAYPSSYLNGPLLPVPKVGMGHARGGVGARPGEAGRPAVFVNTRRSELWTETKEDLKADALLSRLEPLQEYVVPEGAALLTAGVDVQANRIEVYVWAWGAGLESWLVGHFVLEGDPQKEPDQPGDAHNVWAKLDAVLGRRFPHVLSSGAPCVPIAVAIIDTGFATTQVYRYVHRRRGRPIHAVKGVGGRGVPIFNNKPTLQGKERIALYSVGTDAVKTEFIRSQLPTLVEGKATGPGAVHLPDWMTSDQVEQLINEERRRRVHGGRVIYEWRPKRENAPVEAQDCRVYARAALEKGGAKLVAQLGAMAAQVSDPAKQVEVSPEAPSVALLQRRGRRVLSKGLT